MTDTCQGRCSCSGAAPTTTATPTPAAPAIDAPLSLSCFAIPGMDCPAEEQMIRMALAEGPAATRLDFDLEGRKLTLCHADGADAVLARLAPLGFGARLLETRPATAADLAQPARTAPEARTLQLLLAINALMFGVEILAGWWAQSAGLLADALDMLADAAVYGLALYAVGHAPALQRRAAHLSGALQSLLALGMLAEVARRVFFGAEPLGDAMMGVALLALLANVACLLLISRHRHGGAHMRASFIFSANDVIANLGVILAGALVFWLDSPWPDWIIGTLIGVIVLHGAWRILKLR
ncbi:cation transporter [Azovibrio restrictus]|uniref:cation transporter n=1 Tax=Azovibrio restrictus TaxID=146938 RepID=UPI0026F27F15|nr:cation transporter [Azovibrio restrictus]MDD3484765.1 cation transporter [Azovibrio restrictus]